MLNYNSQWSSHQRAITTETLTSLVSFLRFTLSIAIPQFIKLWPSLSIKVLVRWPMRAESLSSPSILLTPAICPVFMSLQRKWLRRFLRLIIYLSTLRIHVKLWVSCWLCMIVLELKRIPVWFQPSEEMKKIVSLFPGLQYLIFDLWYPKRRRNGKIPDDIKMAHVKDWELRCPELISVSFIDGLTLRKGSGEWISPSWPLILAVLVSAQPAGPHH